MNNELRKKMLKDSEARMLVERIKRANAAGDAELVNRLAKKLAELER